MIKTEEFLLPAHWACYLINGDASGMTDAEQAEVDEWETTNAPGPCLTSGDDTELCLRGDDGMGMCERAVYTFQVIDPCFADGEVIGWH